MKKVQNIEANKSVLFERVFGEKPAYEISAAGRINLIGEHVDYCGGKVMPASLNLNCRIFARQNGTNFIRAYADDLDETAIIDIFSLDTCKGLRWGKYQAGVAYELHRAGVSARRVRPAVFLLGSLRLGAFFQRGDRGVHGGRFEYGCGQRV